MALIELPWPPASLSGHNTGNRWVKAGVISKYREWARAATLGITVPEEGDIRVVATFYPANDRGDRCNYPNRMKPIWDGIADGLKTHDGNPVNDKRFLPSFHYAEPVKGGRVTVLIGEY